MTRVGGISLNVIQILSDTFRRDFLGCYVNDWIHTEHLDAFAKKSIVFDRAYLASFPTIPNRRDIFTGRYTFTFSGWAPLPRDEVILSQTLRQAGYVTMLIADAYHLFRDGHYYDRGFDGWWWIRGQENDRYMTNPTKEPRERQKTIGNQYLQNVSLRRFEEDYFVAQTTAAAAKWLELNYDQHEKFFLHVDIFDPHEPWDAPQWYVKMYEREWMGGEIKGGAYTPDEPVYRRAAPLTGEQISHLRALYAAEVTLVDRWIGMLLQKIEDLGLFENTMVIFSTDHGTYHGEHGYIRKNAHLYEEIAHIPLIIRMPDSEGQKIGHCDELVQPPDIMPTILELAGAPQPKTVQGKSVLPIIRGEKSEKSEIAVSSESLLGQQDAYPTYRMTVTSKKFSLITVRSDAPSVDRLGVKLEPELYDLSKDPKQTSNLYREQKDVAQDLHSEAIEFLESLGTSEDILSKWRKIKSQKL